MEARTRPDVIFTTEGEGTDARTLATVGDWQLSVWASAPDGEPRIRDVDAAERLGFKRPRKIRELIERTWPDANSSGIYVRPTVGRTQMPTGGVRETPVTEYWLTEAQLLKVIARSQTPVADAILDDMIRVYLLARRGLLVTPSEPAPTLPTRPVFLLTDALLSARDLAFYETAAKHDPAALVRAIEQTEALARDASLLTVRQTLGALGSAAIEPLTRLFDAMARSKLDTSPRMVRRLAARIHLVTDLLATVASELDARAGGDPETRPEPALPPPDTLSLLSTVTCTSTHGTAHRLGIFGWQGRQWILQADLARLFGYAPETFSPLANVVPPDEAALVPTRSLVVLRNALAREGVQHPSLAHCGGTVRRLLTPAGVVALASRVSAASGVVEALCGAWRMVAG